MLARCRVGGKSFHLLRFHCPILLRFMTVPPMIMVMMIMTGITDSNDEDASN